MFWENHVRVESVDEALDSSDRLHGTGRVIAGGTHLILQLKAGQEKTSRLIDVSSVNSLCGITHKNGKISIGAVTTHSQISISSLVFSGECLLSP